jgi:hypothetical protein
MSGDAPGARSSLDPTDAAFVDVVCDLLRRGHSVRFRAKGGSMHPTIREGEAITAAPAPPAGIKRGEVILRRLGHGVLAHRVVRILRSPDGALVFVTRGDSSAGHDQPAGESEVLGRIIAVERGGRALDPGVWRVRALAGTRLVAVGFLRWLRARLRGGGVLPIL